MEEKGRELEGGEKRGSRNSAGLQGRDKSASSVTTSLVH